MDTLRLRLIEMLHTRCGTSFDTKDNASRIAQKIDESLKKPVILKNETLSSSTIERFLGIKGDKSDKVSVQTLNSICRFLGFPSYAEFETHFKFDCESKNYQFVQQCNDLLCGQLLTKQIEFKIVQLLFEKYVFYPHTITFLNQIVTNAFNDEDADFLKKLWELPYVFEKVNRKNINMYQLSNTIGIMLLKNEALRKTLLPIYAKNEKAKTIFFHHFVAVDYLGKGYEEVIAAYKNECNTDPEDIYFANSILFLYFFKNNNIEKCQALLNDMRKISLDDTTKGNHKPNVHPLPVARNLISELYFANMNNLKPSNELLQRIDFVFEKMKNYHQALSDEPSFFVWMAEAFIDLKDYQNAEKMIGFLPENLPQNHLNKGLISRFYLYRAIVEFEYKRIPEAKNYLSKCLPNNFDIFCNYHDNRRFKELVNKLKL